MAAFDDTAFDRAGAFDDQAFDFDSVGSTAVYSGRRRRSYRWGQAFVLVALCCMVIA